MNETLRQLVNFLQEIEKLQRIKRVIYYPDGSQENDAEHTWHVTMFVMLLSKEVDSNADILRMMKMALIHDLVEIYAGDTYLFDSAKQKTKKERELRAAKQLFKQLPRTYQKEFWELFEEFEALETAEAKIVKSFDWLQPLVHNLIHNGSTYKKCKLTAPAHDLAKRPKMLHNPTILKLYEDLCAEARTRNIFYKEK